VSLKVKYWILATTAVVFSFILSGVVLDFIFVDSSEKDIMNIMLQETKNLSVVYNKVFSSQIEQQLLETLIELPSENNYGYYYMVDGIGNVLFHSDKTRINTNLKKIGLEDLFREFVSKENGIYEYTYDSSKIVAAFSKLKDKNLYLVHAIKKSDILKTVDKAQGLFTILLLIFSSLLAIVIYFFIGYFIKPLVQQTNSVKEFSLNISTSVMENRGSKGRDREYIWFS